MPTFAFCRPQGSHHGHLVKGAVIHPTCEEGPALSAEEVPEAAGGAASRGAASSANRRADASFVVSVSGPARLSEEDGRLRAGEEFVPAPEPARKPLREMQTKGVFAIESFHHI